MEVQLTENIVNLLPVIQRKLKGESVDSIVNQAIGLLYLKLKSCETKKKFKNIKLAQAACQNLARNGILSKEHSPYRCSFCNKFHIGRSSK